MTDDCQQYQSAGGLLSGYLDGQLDPIARGRVADHLQGCASCTRALRRLHDVDRLLREESRVPAPPGLVGAVMARLADEPGAPDESAQIGVLQRPGGRKRFRRAARVVASVCTVAAAALLAFVVAAGMLKESNEAAAPLDAPVPAGGETSREASLDAPEPVPSATETDAGAGDSEEVADVGVQPAAAVEVE